MEVYYERYYRSLLERSSEDINRCMTHALSHPSDMDFQCTCTHTHVVKCEIMQQDAPVVQQMREDIDGKQDTLREENVLHLKWQLSVFEDLLIKYKAHLIVRHGIEKHTNYS